MADLGIADYDLVEIRGTKAASALAVKAYPTDEDMDVARVDGLIRSNVGSSIGQFVEITKAEWRPAEKVSLAPVGRGIQISIPSDALRKVFLGRPVSKGDVISTTTLRRPPGDLATGKDTMFDEIFKRSEKGSAFGLGEVKMRVVSTVPAGTVRIGEGTEVELISRAVDARAAAEVVYEDLGGMRHAIQRVREMIELPLKHPELFERLGIDPPRGVLLHGPPGTGKTMLAKAVANESSAHFASINGPEIVSKFYGESEKRIREVFEESERNAPAIIFLDELDSIAPKREEVAGEMERRMVAQLLSLMDGQKERANVIVIGATNRPDAVDPALRRPGRFDREIELGVPDFEGRREILQIHTRGMPLAQDVDLEEFATLTYGFVGADIAAFIREAAMNALRRVLPRIDLDLPTIPREVLEDVVVTRGDLEAAMHEVSPSALREILIEVPNVTWADVGGLEDVKQLLVEAVEWPLVYGENFRRLGIEAPKGGLLYGPAGTGKTLLAKAVANESNANFLTTKGSEILSKWYGESERHIAEIFRKARQVAPAIVFLDELDSLAPSGAWDRRAPRHREIVNQLLSEIDGMEELRGVES
jgi:transitional endoplasmic reticulum ATPase